MMKMMMTNIDPLQKDISPKKAPPRFAQSLSSTSLSGLGRFFLLLSFCVILVMPFLSFFCRVRYPPTLSLALSRDARTLVSA